MKKVSCLILMVCLLEVILTSCYDAREVDEWAYIYSLGIDKGVSDRFRITIQIPTIKGGSGRNEGSQGGSSNESQGKEIFSVMSVDCPSYYTGINMINTSLSRKVNYMHTKFFIVSEELAKDGIGSLMSAIVREREIRRTMHTIVVRGSASDFIKEINPVVGTAISKTQEGIMNMEDETGYFDDNSFGNFIDNIKSYKEQPSCVLAGINSFSELKAVGPQPKDFKTSGDYYAGELPRTGGNKNEYLGSAVFNGGKMVGELNGDETRVMLIARGDFSRGSFAVPDPYNPRYTDTFDIRQQKKPEVKIAFSDGKPVIDLKIFLEGDLQALQSYVEYESEKLKPVLESKFKAFIKSKLDKTLEKCKKLDCDVFGFGSKAVMKFPTIQEWEAYNWLSHFRDAEVNTEVEFIIRRTGKLIKTNPEKSSGGQRK